MNVREENAARALIQGFLKDSVPEYIKDTGQEILNSGGVHKPSARKATLGTWKASSRAKTSRTIRPT
mgnify:CR=1 FL=1